MTEIGKFERIAIDAAITAGVCEGCPAADVTIERFKFKDKLQERLGELPVSLTARDYIHISTVGLAGITREEVQRGERTDCHSACADIAAFLLDKEAEA